MDGTQNLDVTSENDNTLTQRQGDDLGILSHNGGNKNADAEIENNANSNGNATQDGDAVTNYSVLHDCGGSDVCAAGAWVNGLTKTTLGQDSGSVSKNTTDALQEQEGDGQANAALEAENNANATNTATQNGTATANITGEQTGCGDDSLCAVAADIGHDTIVEGDQDVKATSENMGDYEQLRTGDGQTNQAVEVEDTGNANATGDQDLDATTNIDWAQDCGDSDACGASFDHHGETKATGRQDVTAEQKNETNVHQRGGDSGNSNQSVEGKSTSNSTTTSTSKTTSESNITITQE